MASGSDQRDRRPSTASCCRRLSGWLVWLAITASCGGGEKPPNLLLVTLDTTRADHLSTYGYFRETSPAFDRLAGESLVFDRLIVPMATTLPTHLSLFTGTHPLEHGVLANSTQGGRRFVPAAGLRSFATLSRDAGYRTAAFVSAAPLKTGSGVENGFEVFDQPAGMLRDAGVTTTAAIAWVERVEGPFFLWVHYFDAHFPFAAPPGFRGIYRSDAALAAFIAERRIAATAPRPLVGTLDVAVEVINEYDAEIRFVDSQLDRLLAALAERPDWRTTALVVAGDHGEGLCQHGLAAHGSTWNEQLHAPLLMRVPGVAPRRVASPLSASDVLPTLLGLFAMPQAAAFAAQATGRDVLAAAEPSAPILSLDTRRQRSDGVPYRYALTYGRWKLFRVEPADAAVIVELYDLGEDPFELQEVAAENPRLVRRLRAILEAEIERREELGRALRRGEAPAARPVDPVVREELEALGYL